MQSSISPTSSSCCDPDPIIYHFLHYSSYHFIFSIPSLLHYCCCYYYYYYCCCNYSRILLALPLLLNRRGWVGSFGKLEYGIIVVGRRRRRVAGSARSITSLNFTSPLGLEGSRILHVMLRICPLPPRLDLLTLQFIYSALFVKELVVKARRLLTTEHLFALTFWKTTTSI